MPCFKKESYPVPMIVTLWPLELKSVWPLNKWLYSQICPASPHSFKMNQQWIRLIVMHQNRPSETNRWCHSISVHSVCGLTWRSCFLAFGGTALLRWIRVSAPEVADYLTHFCCSSEFLLQQDCGSRIDLKQMCLNPFINIEVYDFSFRYSCRISSSPVYSEFLFSFGLSRQVTSAAERIKVGLHFTER